MQVLNDGQWFLGLDSISYSLPPGTYQWSQNTSNRGGIVSTRQGFAEVTSKLGQKPRGIVLFPVGGVTHIVAAIGEKIYHYPLSGSNQQLTEITGLSFPTASSKRAVHFELCVQARKTNLPDGEVISIPPKFILIIQDGVTNPGWWDGTHQGHFRPSDKGTVIGDYMKWVGDRLWIVKGQKLYASDLLNPTQFTEAQVTASGGFFFLPAKATGMGATHDFKALLVFTDQTTSAFQVGIEDRTAWPATQDFQRVIFPSIGCVSHRTIVNQYGITWWMAHEGVVGLDTALQAYQSSKLNVRDQNMSRSKQGISWSSGGGCAGAYDNFVFFSVPSGSRYNSHTWVLDQGVVDTINQVSPPAWCSNWTGIRPEQWVTGIVNGVQRCFCISDDVVPEGHQSTIWEAFIGQRMDVPKNNLGEKVAKDIGCALETKFFSISPSDYMRFKWLEIDVAEIKGNVTIHAYYCGRKTSYKQILATRLTAKVSGSVEEVFDPDSNINIYVPQYRTLRSVTDTHEADDNNTEIQTPYIRSIDKEFSVLITWTGQMAITGVRIAVEPELDYNVGKTEEKEWLERAITTDGTGNIGSVLAAPNSPSNALTSKFLAPVQPRWVEFPEYDSAVQNGMFFVQLPELSPVPDGYPANQYPKTVHISTDTAGCHLVYTKDRSRPVPFRAGHNGHGTVINGSTGTVSMDINKRLRVIAYRPQYPPDLVDSLIVTGDYTKAKAENPVFAPIAGSYPAPDFPKTVTITCDTDDMAIRYNKGTNPPNPTRNSGTVYDPDHPPAIAANNWLRAIAYDPDNNYLDSNVVSGRYVALPQCATPTVTPDGGGYDVFPFSVLISTTTNGANIRYTINDTDLDGNGTVILPTANHHVLIHAGDVLRARAEKTNMANSDVKTATYTQNILTVDEPHFSPDGGDFLGQFIRPFFVCTTPLAFMTYTTSAAGSHPPDPDVNSSTHFNNGDQLDVNHAFHGHVVVKLRAFRGDMNPSIVHEVEFDHDHQ